MLVCKRTSNPPDSSHSAPPSPPPPGKAELAAYIAATHKVEPLLVKDEQSKGKEGEGKKDKEKEREKDKGSKKRRPARLSVVDEMQEDDLVAGLAKVYGEGGERPGYGPGFTLYAAAGIIVISLTPSSFGGACRSEIPSRLTAPQVKRTR